VIYKYGKKGNKYREYICKEYVFQVYKSKNEVLITKNHAMALTYLANDYKTFEEGSYEKEIIEVLFTTDVHINED